MSHGLWEEMVWKFGQDDYWCLKEYILVKLSNESRWRIDPLSLERRKSNLQGREVKMSFFSPTEPWIGNQGDYRDDYFRPLVDAFWKQRKIDSTNGWMDCVNPSEQTISIELWN